MYCIKCGVELGESEKKCPLCGLAVYHPELPEIGEAEGPYPKFEKTDERVSKLGAMLALTLLFVLPVLLTLVCDISISSSVTWSGYAVGGLAVAYITAVLPRWFDRPNAVVFVPIDFLVTALYLLYIDLTVRGGWFLTLALPLVCAIGAVSTAVVTLLKYVGRGHLYIFGGALILMGGITVMTELLINYTFRIDKAVFWSLYPLISLAVLGLICIVIAICKPLRSSLLKRFFI